MSERFPPRPALESWHTGRLLTAAARLLEHAFDSGIAELGITHAGFNVLEALKAGPLTQRELAGWCQVQDQTMSRTLDGLERDGFVVRRRDPGDRRRIMVARTPAGEKVVERARELGSRLDLWADSTEEETQACRAQLIKLIGRLGGAR
jgi:DNA-binding MarR family transcriptional regulator